VRTFILADIERELGRRLDPDLYGLVKNQPVIFARSMALAPEPGEARTSQKNFVGRIKLARGG